MKENRKENFQSKQALHLAKTLEEATRISLSLVVLPVLLLFAGLFVDKKFDTTPLFILVSTAVGVLAGVLRAISLGKNLKLQGNG